jgi:hypothetical protein
MHQNVITAEQFADIRQHLSVFGQVERGAVAATIGKHPSLGSCVVFDDMTAELVLLSEIPLDRDTDMHSNSLRS